MPGSDQNCPSKTNLATQVLLPKGEGLGARRDYAASNDYFYFRGRIEVSRITNQAVPALASARLDAINMITRNPATNDSSIDCLIACLLLLSICSGICIAASLFVCALS